MHLWAYSDWIGGADRQGSMLNCKSSFTVHQCQMKDPKIFHKYSVKKRLNNMQTSVEIIFPKEKAAVTKGDTCSSYRNRNTPPGNLDWLMICYKIFLSKCCD